MANSNSWRHVRRATSLLLAPVLVAAALVLTVAAKPAYAASNRIVAENALTGNPASEWDVTGAGDPTLQGFATQMSAAPGESVHFKIDDTTVTGSTTPASYRIDIYRLGYYGGDGARLVGSIDPTAITQPAQPACTLTDPTGFRLLDCGNWAVTASWPVPSGAVSGIYVARLTRTADHAKASHIAFVVRDDTGHSDILVQTSDTTWQAYNPYGGFNAYDSANGGDGNAWKLSYNRPFATRGGELENFLFNSEYPMLRWLESNGYDVSYTTHIDTGLHPERLLDHRVFMSSGHDEYWSQAQRDSVENARAHGVNLAFFSGNEVYWRIRYEDSLLGSAGDQRTMVVYKEGSLAPSPEGEHRRCYLNFQCDPSGQWTGLWRESTNDGLTSTIGHPENALTGQISWRDNTSAITVPSDYASLRFWRNTAVANLTAGQSVTLTSGTLGYEWSPQYEQYMAWYPAGRVLLSSTNAVSTFAGVDQHHLSLYRSSNGGLVFGAGTVQWAWGLDSHHDRTSTQTNSSPDPAMQQATVNLLADMGAQPSTLQAGLVAADKSTDTTPPTVTITSPANGASVPAGPVTVTGTASDIGGAVGVVEVSTDGVVWHPASGRDNWSYTFIAAPGTTTIHVRAADDSANLGVEVARSITVTARICGQSSPCSILSNEPVYLQDPDSSSIEVGVKFRSSTAGYITGVRFYKTADNTGTHTGSLWSAGGTNLASAVFTGESSTGWQDVTFTAPVAVAANTTYVASYHAPKGHYADGNGFTYASVDNPPLSALKDDENGPNGPNGLYTLGSSTAFPTQASGSSNYLVDVLFSTTVGADTTPPAVVSTVPVANAAAISTTANLTATFGEALDATSISASTAILKDSQGAVVPATVTYTGATRTVTIDPVSSLENHATYTVRILGGPGGVADLAGNTLASDYVWSFTTAIAQAPRTDPNNGPGGPVLVATGTGTYDSYLKEILRAEGLNLFTSGTTSALTTSGLAPYTTVVLGETTLTLDQVTALTTWVTAGGHLIAIRPDPRLTGLLGLSLTTGTLSEGYIKVDTSTAPGEGIVSSTMQFHGTADLYTPQVGTQVVAELYSNASTATGHPAVTLRSVGGAGGSAAAFTYDLAGSVVKTRQGNPAWINQNRDGQDGPNRSDDLYYGAAAGDSQPDYVDMTKVDIPQADEQQRLLANVVTASTLDSLPLPRFWYLPSGEVAAIVMTADNHDAGSNASAAARMDQEIAASPAGCSVADWACIRSTTYLFSANSLTDAQAKAYEDKGFEIALHTDTGCESPTASQYADQLSTQLAALASRYPDLVPSATIRNHCVSWSDYTTIPEVQTQAGIHLDTDYYYWPGSWVADRPGLFTGSGFAQRFSTSDGQLIDVYQATTQMTDESLQTYPQTAIALMDAAINQGYYGTFVANIHSDGNSEAINAQIIAAAKARGVPVISAKQLLTWTDGRNASSFDNLAMSGNKLTFSITRGTGANGLEAMLPAQGSNGTLQSLTLNGVSVPTETRTVKGVAYKVFTTGTGSYTATYGTDTTGPVITNTHAAANGNGTVAITWTTDEPSTSRVDFGSAANQLSSSQVDGTLTTTHALTIPGVASTIYYRVTSADAYTNATTWPALASAPASFTMPLPAATDDTVADFTAGATGTSTYVSNTSGGEVILAPSMGAEFDGTSLPSGWTSTQWSAGTGGSTVTGGQVRVDGSLLRTDATYTSGRSVDFGATFSGTANEHAGFAADFVAQRWAIFSTSSGGSLWARVNGSGGVHEVDLGASYLGSQHRYRIDWLADSVVFSIDGTVVATVSATVTGEMEPAVSDLSAGGTTLAVDWMRLTPYAQSGSFLSRIHDAGARADWGTFTWTGATPTSTGLTLSVRTGDTAVPDSTWTAFTEIQNGADVTTRGRYMQYRADAVTSDIGATPELASVTVGYSVLSDQTPPVITGRTPAPGTTGVAIGTTVTIGFSEAVDPSSITATSVRLYASTASTDVTATRTVNGSTVTLTPAAPLLASMAYVVSISTAVTDLVGNPIATPDVWTFTTTATGTFTNTPAPTISGSAVVGTTLTASLPAWTPATDSVSWQWYADNVAIGGATTTSLTLTSAQLGAVITVRATGHASGLADQTSTSLPTAAVVNPHVTAGTVTITGTATVGSTLTAAVAGWAPAGVSYAYQWNRDGSAITGATATTYVPVLADVSHTLSVAATGSLTGYLPTTVTSASTTAVPQPTVTSGTVTITGTATVGATLTAAVAGWAPAGVTYAYQWNRDGSAITGATATTYVPVLADVSHTLSVAATGSLTGYLPTTVTSASTTAVPQPAVTAGTVTITGEAVVSSTLTAVPGTWAPVGVTLSYEWRRDGTAISGATTTTYVPVSADVGHTITVFVTGQLAGYQTATALSAPTLQVVVQPSVTGGTVTITGTATVGSTLTAAVAGWAPAGVTYAYQWNRDGSAITGATATTYVPVLADVSHTLSVAATGSLAGHLPTTVTSASTTAVPQPTVTPGTVTITGTPTVSSTLTADPGSWAPSGVTLAYQWRRGSTAIVGATSATYKPVAADVGLTLAVAVTGTKTGYTSATAVSAATATVQDAVSALAYQAFVKASYQDFLGRQPTASELTAKSTALASGTVSKANYLAALTTSDEWLTAIVTQMYRDTLNRDPDPAGLAGWVSWLRSGRYTVAEVAARFYASDEYYQVSANSNTSTWVTLLYQKLLHRSPDAAGLQSWIAATAVHGRDWVAYNFYQSEESRLQRVEAMYQKLLAREPDSTGWPFWAARVLQTGDLQLAWEIANSDEYWNRAHTRY